VSWFDGCGWSVIMGRPSEDAAVLFCHDGGIRAMGSLPWESVNCYSAVRRPGLGGRALPGRRKFGAGSAGWPCTSQLRLDMSRQ
jgi:hypothetical protein